jgi:glycosyltransferase involved in cell wall biosynthesis
MSHVALLMPHYNNPEGLLRSLSSIDAEEHIDIYIVDDGSTKETIDEAATLNAFKASGNIYFKYLSKNVGIENALNKGLDWIMAQNKYRFIARLDCGDICLEKRFEIQEKFLTENPDIMLVSSNIICIDTEGNFLYNLDFPATSEEIKKKMYLNSMFSHPCSMFPAKIIDTVGKYPTKYKAAEDYALFFKIVRNYKTANIQQYLLKYEINPNGISHTKRKSQVMGRIRVILDHFYFGFWPIYGLLRSIVLYVLPHWLILKVKMKTK